MNEAKRGVFWLIDRELLCFPFDENAEHGVAKTGNTGFCLFSPKKGPVLS